MEERSSVWLKSVHAQPYISTHSQLEIEHHTESLIVYSESQSIAIVVSRDVEECEDLPLNTTQPKEVQPTFLWLLPSTEEELQEGLYRQREEVREQEHGLLLPFDKS